MEMTPSSTPLHDARTTWRRLSLLEAHVHKSFRILLFPTAGRISCAIDRFDQLSGVPLFELLLGKLHLDVTLRLGIEICTPNIYEIESHALSALYADSLCALQREQRLFSL